MTAILDDLFEKTSKTEISLSGGTKNKTTPWQNDTTQHRAYDIKVFIGYEMALVTQVENVFVHKEDELGKILRVTVVVDKRDSDVREAIFRREQAVMDEMKSVDFDFHIIAREGRPLELLISEDGGGESVL
jgi:hypothetical protein